MSRISGFVRRAGWWGSGLALLGLFFLLGMIVSFLDGDTGTALQALIVFALLAAGTVLVIRSRRIAASRRPESVT